MARRDYSQGVTTWREMVWQRCRIVAGSPIRRMATAGTSVLRAPSMPIVTTIEEIEDCS